jgi:hypothetical protein
MKVTELSKIHIRIPLTNQLVGNKVSLYIDSRFTFDWRLLDIEFQIVMNYWTPELTQVDSQGGRLLLRQQNIFLWFFSASPPSNLNID